MLFDHRRNLPLAVIGALLAGAALSAFASGQDARFQPLTEAPAGYELQTVEGWTCVVDRQLLAAEHAAARARTFRLLGDQLHQLTRRLSTERIADLRTIRIWIDLDHPKLKQAQYHPGAKWLADNGIHPALFRCVHIPNAAQFIDPRHDAQQPCVALHELAHAYHDQFLGFDHAAIRERHAAAVRAGSYDSVLHIDGGRRKHYALTDPKEFFAELTECYLGVNDFYPFVRAELAEHDPESHRLLEAIWGKVAEQVPAD
jgi:hypothetical protein